VDVRMPPMVLLPLIERAMTHFGNGQRRVTIHITSSSVGDTLRVTISENGPGFNPDRTADGCAAICARLSALYGTAASLVLRRRTSGANEAVMEIPYEAIVVAAAG
jgi:LytS/YehU family sensor histidine kinase